jgi:DHA2 family multidrug resistance protein-like MFS transporter
VSQQGHADDPADGLPAPQRYWAILAIWLTLALAILDTSIANIALPTISHELHATAASAIWIVNAFQLAMVVSLLPLSVLGDRFGYRRVYTLGVAVFTLGSLACALSHSLPQLTAARVLQGFGASGIMSINTAIVRSVYPTKMLGRGIGYNALVVSIASAAGPSVAAAILSVASWQWLFAVNVPIGLLSLLIGSRSLPRAPGSRVSVDIVSALLNAVMFGGLVIGAEKLSHDSLALGAGLLIGAGAAGVLLVSREWSRPTPLVPLDLLRVPIIALSMCTSVATFCGQMMALVALPFFFQGPLGRTTIETGLLITAWPIGVAFGAPVAGHLADRYPAGALGGIGLAAFAAGLACLSQIHPQMPDSVIVAAMALCGVGFGFFQSPNARGMIAATPRHRSGAVGGLQSTGRLLGQTSGALATAMFFHVDGPQSAPLVLMTACGFAVVAMVFSLTRLTVASAGQPARAPAAAISEET